MKINQVSLAVAAAVAAVCGSVETVLAGGCGSTLLSQNFNSYSGDFQQWSKEKATSDFPGLIFVKFYDNSAVGEKVLRSTHPKGCVGTAQCGVTFDVAVDPVTEATLTYKVKFDKDYDFALGGKLPGICSDDCPSGCVDMTNRGWSSRVMWREGGDVMSYMYTADKSSSTSCGTDWEWGKSVATDQWHKVKMYVKVNDAGKSNGVQKIWVNNNKVLEKDDIMYLTDDKHKIEKFTFRNFHGGSGSEWAPDHDQSQYFDDIKVQQGEC